LASVHDGSPPGSIALRTTLSTIAEQALCTPLCTYLFSTISSQRATQQVVLALLQTTALQSLRSA